MALITRNPATWPQASGYGMLYNGYCIFSTKNLAASGWRVPTIPDVGDLIDNKTTFQLKSKYQINHSNSAFNTHAKPCWPEAYTSGVYNTDDVAFSAFPSGMRRSDGLFISTFYSDEASNHQLNSDFYMFADGYYLGDGPVHYHISHYLNAIGSSGVLTDILNGCSVRLCRDAFQDELDYRSEGWDGIEEDQYIGNDGKKYDTVMIGSLIWVRTNLCETKFRDGTAIPIVQSTPEWVSLTTPARCFPKNDIGWV